jgi:hypothetical protein
VVLAEVAVPYFNRTYRHFCSHRHTPSSGEIGYPGIVCAGKVIYFAHPIFRQYHENAPRWCKSFLLNALDILLPEPLVRHNGPSTLQVTLNEQSAQHRWVLHLLHYIPERRSQTIDVIEDVIPLYQVDVSVRSLHKVHKVRLVPQQEEIPFIQEKARIKFTVPKVDGHQMVEIQF